MLLGRLPVGVIPELLTKIYGFDTTTETSLPLQYLPHIRHLHLDEWNIYHYDPYSWKQLLPDVLECIQDEHQERLLTDSADDPPEEWYLFQQCLRTSLYREASWSLANPILGQLESMTIPISAIDRYIGVVDCMGKLEHVCFLLDVVVGSGKDFYGMSPEELRAITTACKEECMVRFIKSHAQLFQGQLKTARIVNCSNWDQLGWTCPDSIRLAVYRALPPLHQPTSLWADNWMHFAAHPLSTNLDYVQQIDTTESPPEFWFDTDIDHLKLLQRCRALRSLSIRLGGQGRSAMKGSGSISPQLCLAPLEMITIKECDALTDEVDDIAVAFSQTLRKLAVSYIGRSAMNRPFHVGRGWIDLPLLTQLWLDIRCARLVLDSDLFTHCPNLSTTDLCDETTLYYCQDIVPRSPDHLADIRHLHLTGWSALTFHPATLDSTTRLESLNLSVFILYGRCYIPPIEELNRSYGLQDSLPDPSGIQAAPVSGIIRPHWTWNWDLPQLTTLQLSGEFAYRFEFRMLRRCAALVTLVLNTITERLHPRVLTEEDLFVPGLGSDPNAPQERERIVAPVLRELRLLGPWICDDSLLPQLLTGMFPNLEELEGFAKNGILIGDLIKWVRTTPNRKIRELKSWNFGPDEMEMAELGLFYMEEIEEEATWPVVISFSNRDYVLLQDESDSQDILRRREEKRQMEVVDDSWDS
ncbi:hypothetical protein BGX23_011170 [Mortierella sp. AD031]|nr:hypothetical protein BGX23_011170 [Mortierella sp. AD031]